MPSTILLCDKPCALLLATRKMLKEDRRSLAFLAMEFDLPYYWLKSFSEGRAKNPSVNRVIYLHERLSKR